MLRLKIQNSEMPLLHVEKGNIDININIDNLIDKMYNDYPEIEFFGLTVNSFGCTPGFNYVYHSFYLRIEKIEQDNE